MGPRSLRRGKRRSLPLMLSRQLLLPSSMRALKQEHMSSRLFVATEGLLEPEAKIASEQTR